MSQSSRAGDDNTNSNESRGGSTLVEWLTNALAYGRLIPSDHSHETLKTWMKSQKTPKYYRQYAREEPTDELLREAVLYFGQFWFLLQQGLAGGGHSPLNQEYIALAVSNLACAIKHIQYLDESVLRLKPTFIDGIINATIYSLGLFGNDDWADAMQDSRVEHDPVKSFLGWYQPPCTYDPTSPPSVGAYYRWFEEDIKCKTGRLADNRYWYTPSFVPDAEGKELIQNLGFSYVTPEDEAERKMLEPYYQKFGRKRCAESRSKVPGLKRNPKFVTLKTDQERYDHLFFNFAGKNRRKKVIRLWLPRVPSTPPTTSSSTQSGSEGSQSDRNPGIPSAPPADPTPVSSKDGLFHFDEEIEDLHVTDDMDFDLNNVPDICGLCP